MVLGGRRGRRRGGGGRCPLVGGGWRGPGLGELRKGAWRLKPAARWIPIMALALASCGGGTKPCNPGTIMLTVRLDAMTAEADAIDVATTIDGKTTDGTASHRSGVLEGTIEVSFDMYAAGGRVDFTLTARKGSPSRLLGTGTGSIVAVPQGCATLTIDVFAADAGAAGSGGRGGISGGGTGGGGTGGGAAGTGGSVASGTGGGGA